MGHEFTGTFLQMRFRTGRLLSSRPQAFSRFKPIVQIPARDAATLLIEVLGVIPDFIVSRLVNALWG